MQGDRGFLQPSLDNPLDMVLDAYDQLAGNKAVTGGIDRPSKEKTQQEIEQARLIWTSTQYATNEEAFAVLQREGWTKYLMDKYKIGPSGRATGKPKKK